MGFKTNEAVSSNETAKIKSFMKEGKHILQQIEDLKGGLRDTAKALAEELDCKPGELMKSLRVAFKASMEAEKEALSTVEDILVAAGEL